MSKAVSFGWETPRVVPSLFSQGRGCSERHGEDLQAFKAMQSFYL